MPDPRFVVVQRGGDRSQTAGTFTLVEDNWDDFHFKTSFVLHYADKSGVVEIGYVKIANRGMAEYDPLTKLPRSFSRLGPEFFSLGQDREYYETLRALPGGLSEQVLLALHDVAADKDLLRDVEQEPALSTSLLRDIPRRTVETQFRQIIAGHAPLTPYRFSFSRDSTASFTPPFRIQFGVHPGTKPPTNVQVLIGANGVGKSSLLREFLAAATGSQEPGVGRFRDEMAKQDELAFRLPFSSVVHVAFSAFDPAAEVSLDAQVVGARAVGLSASNGEALEDQFVDSLRICGKGPRRSRWVEALRTLSTADSLLNIDAFIELLDVVRVDEQARARRLFSDLSSGHKIVVLTVSRLVELVEERTLVLMDEPETHLHPPLLSALIRAVSDLLISRNGVAVLATHSPVVLQEVPRTCVHVLRRAGGDLRVGTLETESFGESVSRLTAEVFHLDVRRTGYHQLLRQLLLERRGAADLVLDDLEGQLGSEGRFVLHALARELGEGDV